jgi:hypothetical protein
MEVTDYLEYTDYCQRIIQVISFYKTSNLLLFGDWGTGKTKLLDCLEMVCINGNDYHVIRFNPWLFESTNNLLIPLLREILNSCSKYFRNSEDLRIIFKSLMELFADIGLRGISNFASFGNAQIKMEDIDRTLSIYDDLENKGENKITRCQELFSNFISEILKSTKKSRVLILIDDLDRCLPNNMISLIESIKLYISNIQDLSVSFIWAMDKNIVEETITHKYGLTSFNGKKYIEKIFDKQLPIPDFNSSKVQLYFQGLYSDSTYKEEIKQMFIKSDLQQNLEKLNIRPLRNQRKLKNIWRNIEYIAKYWDSFKAKAQEIGLLNGNEPDFINKVILGLIIAYCYSDWRIETIDHFDTWPTFILNNKKKSLSEGTSNILLVLNKFEIVDYHITDDFAVCDIDETHFELLNKLSNLLHGFSI